ncbi:hypothetical protein H0A65_07130 [Alcaligenaceae bacterium]|nr:hypothetical protein [Alcaligenaceae bacterium]
MLPAHAAPVLVLRLATDGQLWRLPREADIRLRLLNMPLAEIPAWAGISASGMSAGADKDHIFTPGTAIAALLAFGQAQPWKGPCVVLSPAFQHNVVSLWTILAELAKCGFGDATWSQDTCLLLENEAQQLLAYALPPKWQTNLKQLSALQAITARYASKDHTHLDAASFPLKRITVALPEYAAQDTSKIP